MKVLFFSQCRRDAGCAECWLETPPSLRQTAFWHLLLIRFPELAPHQDTARLVRDDAYLLPEDLLEPADEIAVLPPVSGG